MSAALEMASASVFSPFCTTTPEYSGLGSVSRRSDCGPVYNRVQSLRPQNPSVANPPSPTVALPLIHPASQNPHNLLAPGAQADLQGTMMLVNLSPSTDQFHFSKQPESGAMAQIQQLQMMHGAGAVVTPQSSSGEPPAVIPGSFESAAHVHGMVPVTLEAVQSALAQSVPTIQTVSTIQAAPLTTIASAQQLLVNLDFLQNQMATAQDSVFTGISLPAVQQIQMPSEPPTQQSLSQSQTEQFFASLAAANLQQQAVDQLAAQNASAPMSPMVAPSALPLGHFLPAPTHVRTYSYGNHQPMSAHVSAHSGTPPHPSSFGSAVSVDPSTNMGLANLFHVQIQQAHAAHTAAPHSSIVATTQAPFAPQMSTQTVSYMMLPPGTTMTQLSIPAAVHSVPMVQEILDASTLSLDNRALLSVVTEEVVAALNRPSAPTESVPLEQPTEIVSTTGMEISTHLPPLPPHMPLTVAPHKEGIESASDPDFAHAIKGPLQETESSDCVDVNLIFNAPPSSGPQENGIATSSMDPISLFAPSGSVAMAELVSAERAANASSEVDDTPDVWRPVRAVRPQCGFKTVGSNPPNALPVPSGEYAQDPLEVVVDLEEDRHPSKRQKISADVVASSSQRKVVPTTRSAVGQPKASVPPPLELGSSCFVEAFSSGVDEDDDDSTHGDGDFSDDTDYDSNGRGRKRVAKTQGGRSGGKATRMAQSTRTADVLGASVDANLSSPETSPQLGPTSRLRARRSSGSRKVKAAVSRFDVKTIVVPVSEAPEGSEIHEEGVSALVFPCPVCDKLWPKLYNLKVCMSHRSSSRSF
ncbi:hypothetical protein M427DRAFT_328903 [Gonapodya prolifera JEL478]|uniref:Uncharacterized protein n=1 Tax=Gonapodya prolifera (strain JEL478) TaxID=1344416 RepID=A0A139AET3_GONPJ|nr:hypothetical protein M427DRAFT_328903 [Gonapodya prolifera JEL478]|eukprot:KXS15094.1 hypothetical protein M427DRAFT_328903 [Gonapodya prolifera JEL478]